MPETAAGVRKPQRTLYRQTKSMGDRRNNRLVPAHEMNRKTASETQLREIRLVRFDEGEACLLSEPHLFFSRGRRFVGKVLC